MNKLIHNKKVRVVGKFGLTIYLHDSGKIGCSIFPTFLMNAVKFLSLFSAVSRMRQACSQLI